MNKSIIFMVGSACLVIAVSIAVLFSFSENIPYENQLARIESAIPYPQGGALPALPNPNFPPPPISPLIPRPDPIGTGGFPEADPLDIDEMEEEMLPMGNPLPPPIPPMPTFVPELATPPIPLGIIDRVRQWYQEWLENLRLRAIPETVVPPRRR